MWPEEANDPVWRERMGRGYRLLFPRITKREKEVVANALVDLMEMKDGDPPTFWLKLVFRKRHLMKLLADVIKYQSLQPA